MALQRYNMYIVETGPLRTPKVCSCASTETGEWVKAGEAEALEKRVAELEQIIYAHVDPMQCSERTERIVNEIVKRLIKESEL